MAEWMSYPMYYAFDGAAPPARAGAAHATIFPYGPFVAGDGKSVMLGLQNEREWVAFCNVVLEQPSVATDERFSANARRSENKAALQAIIDQSFAALTASQVVERLEKAQIANAQMNDMADLWEHPQLKARGRWVDVDSSVGSLPAMLPPGIPSAEGARMDAVPALGQHSEIILQSLGYGLDSIEAMKKDSVI
jgi:itaconate CoA-transferase